MDFVTVDMERLSSHQREPVAPGSPVSPLQRRVMGAVTRAVQASNAGDYGSAIEHLDRALRDQANIPINVLCFIYATLSRCYIQTGDKLRAIEYAELQVQHLAREDRLFMTLRANIHDLRTNAYNNLGLAHYHFGNFEQGLAAFQHASDCAQITGKYELIMAVEGNMGNCLGSLGRFKEALAHHIDHHRLARTVATSGTREDEAILARAAVNVSNDYYSLRQTQDGNMYHQQEFRRTGFAPDPLDATLSTPEEEDQAPLPTHDFPPNLKGYTGWIRYHGTGSVAGPDRLTEHRRLGLLTKGLFTVAATAAAQAGVLAHVDMIQASSVGLVSLTNEERISNARRSIRIGLDTGEWYFFSCMHDADAQRWHSALLVARNEAHRSMQFSTFGRARRGVQSVFTTGGTDPPPSRGTKSMSSSSHASHLSQAPRSPSKVSFGPSSSSRSGTADTPLSTFSTQSSQRKEYSEPPGATLSTFGNVNPLYAGQAGESFDEPEAVDLATFAPSMLPDEDDDAYLHRITVQMAQENDDGTNLNLFHSNTGFQETSVDHKAHKTSQRSGTASTTEPEEATLNDDPESSAYLNATYESIPMQDETVLTSPTPATPAKRVMETRMDHEPGVFGAALNAKPTDTTAAPPSTRTTGPVTANAATEDDDDVPKPRYDPLYDNGSAPLDIYSVPSTRRKKPSTHYDSAPAVRAADPESMYDQVDEPAPTTTKASGYSTIASDQPKESIYGDMQAIQDFGVGLAKPTSSAVVMAHAAESPYGTTAATVATPSTEPKGENPYGVMGANGVPPPPGTTEEEIDPMASPEGVYGDIDAFDGADDAYGAPLVTISPARPPAEPLPVFADDNGDEASGGTAGSKDVTSGASVSEYADDAVNLFRQLSSKH